MTRRMMTATVLLAALLTAAAASATEDPALHVRYGDPAVSVSAEIDAMAGTGAALYRGGFSNVFNPACLALGEGWRVDVAGELRQVHEDRFVPLWDSFESRVIDTAIASNRHHHFANGLALAGRLPVAWRPVTAALSLTERYAFGYDFSETVREPNTSVQPPQRDHVIQDRGVEIDGALHALSGGLGAALTDWVSVGAAAHYAFGTRDQVKRVRDYDVPTDSYREDAEYAMHGLYFTFGTRVRVDDRLSLGLAYDSPLKATGDTHVETTWEAYPDSVGLADATAGVNYPRVYRLGLAYQPRTVPRTVFTVDAAYAEWSDLKDSRMGGHVPVDDTWDVRAGLEHRFYNDTVARFGYRHLDSYDDPEVGTSFFTAGVGFPAGGGTVDVSASLSKFSSERAHWFSYPADFSAPALARVDDMRFGLGAGYTRAF